MFTFFHLVVIISYLLNGVQILICFLKNFIIFSLCFYLSMFRKFLYLNILFLKVIWMFGLSLPPEFCRRAHVFFTLFVFVYLKWCPTHVVFLFCLSLFCEPYVASFSGLSIFYCPFGIFYRLLNWLHQVSVGMIYRCLLILYRS